MIYINLLSVILLLKLKKEYTNQDILSKSLLILINLSLSQFSWYRQLCLNINYSPWQSGPVLISPQMRVVPYLLRMKWEGHPLYYHTSLGWGYIVPVTLHRNQIGQWGPEDVIK